MRLLCESMFIPIERRILIQKIGRKISFSYEIKASIPFILMRRMCLWSPFMKRTKIIRESVFTTFDGWTLILKKGGGEVFLMKRKHQFICPNKENEFMAPNYK